LRSPDAETPEALPDGCAIVTTGGRSWSYERGHDPYGVAFTVDSIWPLYCASKPLVAAAALALERLGELDLDAPLGAIVPWRTSHYVASLTPSAILDHRTDLPDIPGLLAFVMSDEDRWRTVYGAPGSPHPASHSSYSVFCGYFIIGHVVEYVTGLPLGAAVRALVTDPIGIDDLGFLDTADEHRARADRIVVPSYRSTNGSVATLPATGVRAAAVATRPNAAFGAVGSVRGLAAFVEHLASARHRTAVPALLSDRFADAMARPFDGPAYDATLRRVSQFRCGFEVDLGAHGFGPSLGADAFGHASEGGGITLLVDPHGDRWVAAAVAVLESDADELRARRERLVEVLLAAGADRADDRCVDRGLGR
jgi:CubicO group peptidase (beta-lactamase class C family)